MHPCHVLTLAPYSFGVGDRFGHQARAQLAAFLELARLGVHVSPVWNKSNREHTFIGSHPQSVRQAAQAAVEALGWNHPWHVDADHIRLETVDRFLDSSDFFTIDVADSIGKPAAPEAVQAFMARHSEWSRPVEVAGIPDPIILQPEQIERIASHYLQATIEAGAIYRRIAAAKGGEHAFIAEVSMDETDAPQQPPELLIILAALADQGIRAQTIAPKFTGRFNKGVDYAGDPKAFEREFRDDVHVVRHAVSTYGLPSNLKLSIHSGSDKFSLYPVLRRVLRETGAGIHIKTAGTTWLEELIGLAEAGGAGLELAKEIHAQAMDHIDELCAPYASVIDIDRARLPALSEVRAWTGPRFARALRHIPSDPCFNASLRQLLHVSFKLAAKAGARYTDLLKANEAIVSRQVTENLYHRHLAPIFLG